MTEPPAPSSSPRSDYRYDDERVWYARRHLAMWLVPLVVVAGVGTWLIFRGDGVGPVAQCATTDEVTISASPAMAEGLPAVLNLVEAPACTTYVIDSEPTPITASRLRRDSSHVPSAWISDSDMWVEWLRSKGRDLPGNTPNIASSPLVVAVPKNGQVPKPATWLAVSSDQHYRIVDPRTSTESILAMIVPVLAYATDPEAGGKQQTATLAMIRRTSAAPDLIRKSTAASASEPLFPTTEQQVATINATGERPGSLTAVVPTEGTAALTYSWVPIAEEGSKGEAVRAFYRALSSEAGQRALHDAGFRTPNFRAAVVPEVGNEPKIVAIPTGPQLEALMNASDKATKPLFLNAVVDVSGSMLEQDGPRGVTRMDAAVDAATDGLALIGPNSSVGAWIFSTGLDGSKDYLELAPVKKLGDSTTSGHRGLLMELLADAPNQVRGDTGLYDTVKAAYANSLKTWAPGHRNVLFVLTDGQNDDSTGGISLAQLRADLSRMQDPNKPITVLLVGIGSGTSEDELKSIISVLKPTAEQSSLAIIERDPAKLRAVFVKALLHGTR